MITRKGGRFTQQEAGTRFWSKVDKTETCWIWSGSKSSEGYGYIRWDGKGAKAHRISYQLHWGEIPTGLIVDHKCFNRACVNPKHLRLVTIKQNGEHRKGANPNSISGVRGVTWRPKEKRWVARLGHNGVDVHLGVYGTLEEADAAVKAARLAVYTHDDSYLKGDW